MKYPTQIKLVNTVTNEVEFLAIDLNKVENVVNTLEAVERILRTEWSIDYLALNANVPRNGKYLIPVKYVDGMTSVDAFPAHRYTKFSMALNSLMEMLNNDTFIDLDRLPKMYHAQVLNFKM